MNRITINGQVFETDGSVQIVVNNGTITVGGKVVASGLNGVVMWMRAGPLATLRSDASVTCGDVHGDVDAGGSVQSTSVKGSVSAGGSVNCGSVGGNVKAGGSVNHR